MMILFNLLLHRPVREKWCVRDIIRSEKTESKIWDDFKGSAIRMRTDRNRPYCPDFKPPLPSPCGHEQGRGGWRLIIVEGEGVGG